MIDENFALVVETTADPYGKALPQRFRLGTQVIEVAEVLDRWPGRDHLYVKLLGSDGALYILRQDLDQGGWGLVLFRGPSAPDQAGSG
jgi:hypothetical protein